jgi:hypothetical protein
MPAPSRKHWATEVKFRQFFWDLPDIIAGRKRRHTTAQRRAYNAFWSTVIQTLFVELHHAYEQKSQLYPDDNGQMWAQQTQEYRAYKREKAGYLTGNQRRKYVDNTPGLLTPHQYSRWKKTFRKVYEREIRKRAKVGGSGSDIQAKAKAASIAWAEAKSKGAETLLSEVGTQFFPILRFTDTLYKSFRPGRINNLKYNKGDKNQVARLKNGYAEIGTSVPYAEHVSRKIKRGISKKDKSKGYKTTYTVKREILPDDLGIFYDRACSKGRDALAAEIQKLAKENKLLER